MPKKMQVQQTGKWNKAAKAEKKREREKERIRSAFEDRRDVEFIPATIVSDSSDKPKMRVAAYCRVSTLEDAQAGSFELQIQHFQQMIAANDRWEDVGIYADEGKSGTNMKRRPQFQKMIQDCRDGKIDLILTKSVSRFARNTMDCLRVVRELKALNMGFSLLKALEFFVFRKTEMPETTIPLLCGGRQNVIQKITFPLQ